MCMSFVAVSRSLTIVSYVAFKMAALWFWTMFNCNPPIAHCHPLLWDGGILVDHWSTISSLQWNSQLSWVWWFWETTLGMQVWFSGSVKWFFLYLLKYFKIYRDITLLVFYLFYHWKQFPSEIVHYIVCIYIYIYISKFSRRSDSSSIKVPHFCSRWYS